MPPFKKYSFPCAEKHLFPPIYFRVTNLKTMILCANIFTHHGTYNSEDSQITLYIAYESSHTEHIWDCPRVGSTDPLRTSVIITTSVLTEPYKDISLPHPTDPRESM